MEGVESGDRHVVGDEAQGGACVDTELEGVAVWLECEYVSEGVVGVVADARAEVCHGLSA